MLIQEPIHPEKIKVDKPKTAKPPAPRLTIELGLDKQQITSDGIYWLRIYAYKNRKLAIQREMDIKKGVLPMDLAIRDILIHL